MCVCVCVNFIIKHSACPMFLIYLKKVNNFIAKQKCHLKQIGF